MPPRYAYWTILVDDQPTAFRASSQEDLMPTLKRLQAKHPSAKMMWWQNGKLWDRRVDAQDAMHTRGELGRRGDSRQAGGGFRDRERKPFGDRKDGGKRTAWTPRGEPSSRPPARNADEKLDWKPKGEFVPAPKRADRAERPRSFDREERPRSFTRPAFKPSGDDSRAGKPEWKPKGSFDRKTEWKPKGSFDRGSKPDWKPKSSFDRGDKRDWKSKSSSGRDGKPDWKPKGSFDRESKPDWKPKGSFDRESKPDWKPKGSFDRESKPDWKPKGSFDRESKPAWKPKSSFDRGGKPEWKPRGKNAGDGFSSPPRERKPGESLDWKPKGESSEAPAGKRKWVPKEEYKKSMGIEARRDKNWRPGGLHKDPKQKYKDAKKAKWTRFKKAIRTRSESKGKKSEE
jgi:hypothetical protein